MQSPGGHKLRFFKNSLAQFVTMDATKDWSSPSPQLVPRSQWADPAVWTSKPNTPDLFQQ